MVVECGDLVSCMIMLGEKGADIARIIRSDSNLLSLLVQEKTESEKNPRFVRDFKTLADVLIQQLVKYHLHKSFSDLEGCVYGEESDCFQSGDDKIRIVITDDIHNTQDILSRLLEDDVVCRLLSTEIHRGVETTCLSLPHLTLPPNLAVWIDPIDSTCEYIHGDEVDNNQEISYEGVRCVTVLIGVFSKDTGEPLVGLINQPFYRYQNNRWRGRHVWGVSVGEYKESSISSLSLTPNKVILISSSESEEVRQCLKSGGYQVVQVSGAGNKGLGVILGVGCAYVLSKATTYPWDICPVDAILRSIGGGVVNFTTNQPLVYDESAKPNSGGLIAYINTQVLSHIRSLLATLPSATTT